MPELDNIQEKPPVTDVNEQSLIAKLFEYLDTKHNPWRKEFEDKIKECFDFKELRQWRGEDEELLKKLKVPAVPIDRINRGLDTIDGIRENTGSRKKIVKQEMGDERVADVLDKVMRRVEYNGNFDTAKDEAFKNLKDVGIGIRKIGFDPQLEGGEGAAWCENCNIEDVYWRWGKERTLADAPVIIHSQTMDWEQAMMINPLKAGELKAMKKISETNWQKLRGTNVRGQASAVDYGQTTFDNSYMAGYPNQVDVHEFWVKQRIPLKKIGYVESTQSLSPEGFVIDVPTPMFKEVPIEYQAQEGEQEIAVFVREQYNQFVVAGDKNSSILLKQGTAEDHPFVGECAEKKKSGAPRGYIETVIPAQQRINLAWAQKIAFNVKAIKSPIVTKGGTYKAEESELASSFGSTLNFPRDTDIVSINTVPNVNLQAVEEGNIARQDMDFAAAATEMPLRGMSESSASGIKLSLQQNAAITPLNKWIKAEQDSEMVLGRKLLKLIVKYYKPERIARIIGGQEFLKLTTPQMNPMTGEMIPPLQFPFPIDTVNFDVIIENQAVSDLNKQQAFNATEALVQGGILFDDEYRIKNAPIKNIDDALLSNQKAKMDFMRRLMAENQMLKNQLGEAEKLIPKENKGQARNAIIGRNASQSGKRSMLGGQNG